MHLPRLVLALTSLAPLALSQQPGVWKDGDDDVPGWTVVTSKHYQIQSQCGEEKAERLAQHMEHMLHVYKKTFRGSSSQFSRRAVKLFKDRNAYVQYGGSPGSAGYYIYTHRELVLFDSGRWSDQNTPTTGSGGSDERRFRTGMDVLGVAAHEGWHQFFHWYVVSMIRLPSWINEGMGDYFYAGRPIRKGRRAEVDFSAINEDRFPIVYAAVKQDKAVPLEKFLMYTQREYYSNPAVCYAQGWALCYFLNESGNRRYERIIPSYIRYVRDDSNFETVTAKAFRGVDLEELEEEFHEFVLHDMKEMWDEARGGKGDGDGDGEEGKKKRRAGSDGS